VGHIFFYNLFIGKFCRENWGQIGGKRQQKRVSSIQNPHSTYHPSTKFTLSVAERAKDRLREASGIRMDEQFRLIPRPPNLIPADLCVPKLRSAIRDSYLAVYSMHCNLKIFSPPIHSAGFLSNQHERAFYPAACRMGNSFAHAVNIT